jgi:hypothetical protein
MSNFSGLLPRYYFLDAPPSPPPQQQVSTSHVRTRSSPNAVAMEFDVPGPINILGGDGYTSAIARYIHLKLVRDVTTENIPTTYWTLTYNYYNGSYRWEALQNLNIDFVDEYGAILVKTAISVRTPSGECHYGAGQDVLAKGNIDFDFVGYKLRIVPSGEHVASGGGDKDHKC